VVTLSPNAYSGGYGTYPPPANGDWVITNETLVENETIILNGNLIVESGGNLTLKNVTLKMNCAENGTYHIEVQDGGSMYILEGSNITSNTPDGIHRFEFWVWEGANFEMRDSELHECGYYIDYWIYETKGLYIEANGSRIANSSFSENYVGLIVNNSGSSEVTDSIFCENAMGISLSSTGSNYIFDTYFHNNSMGIDSWFSDRDVISGCKFTDNWAGTYLLGFTNGTLTDNVFSNNFFATYSFSNGCELRNNTFLNCTYNFVLPDYYLPHDLDIDSSNTIEGSSIYVFSNVSDMEISPDSGYDDMGYLAIFNSQNVSINNISIHNNGQGLLLSNSNNCTIENSRFSDNIRGIALFGSSGNRINNCDLIDNKDGIVIWDGSEGNVLQNSNIINCNVGVWLSRGNNNTVNDCIISNNSLGIRCRGIENTIMNCIISNNEEGINATGLRNRIFHNNFIQNEVHAVDDDGDDQWDDGQTGGNFWDDYTGLDDGSNNRIAGDGIGDTELPHLDLDNFPFMEMDGWLTNDPPDTDSDGVWDLMDSDDDNDGYNDTLEQEEETDPLDPLSKPEDTDGDLIPDSTDPDIDDDGFPNEIDHFPQDPNKWREERESNWSIIIAFFILLVFCFIIIGFIIRKKGKKDQN
jgi:parallel beta-helix repeat protein